MERYFEPEPIRQPLRTEQLFFISRRELKRNVGIPESEFSRLLFSLERNRFQEVERTEVKRGVEVLWHAESSTIVVPPPHAGTITMADLPVMAVPVVGFIDQTQPDIVVGCDRGARLYAIAVHAMWSKLKSGQERFPTLDSTMHFARLSTSLGTDVTSAALFRIVEKSTRESERHGKDINGNRLRIMFIDDWVSSGATRGQIMESLDAIGLLDKTDINFAVMCGESADVSGSSRRVSVPWQDNPPYIGVNYTRDGMPFAMRTNEAREMRSQLHRATRKVAHKITQG
ncbi:hypothetical protein A3A75_05195 [Candidatus Woesebacteria bacterium RIFCSPLOWO2_01_FULL_39_10]|uniref:Uncharacterized protein n=1 Tax=Candidatus Woesebacteria bacterium RIFCSPLOWO2_01_FULL_39_10 TaxID=1802516 RepID=A0A1F8B4W7_9BACT|nr:MAG: hypothetical protein A3A75_05195 [Candidatus Woesebacteria bacterium RIFCSPLOWO2_01_FULL_39_10]